MSRSNTRALTCSQHDTTQNLADFQQPPTADELRAHKLRQRFALAAELARTVADLAFAADART